MDWIFYKDKLPERGQLCILLHKNKSQVAGPLPWMADEKGENGMWVDLFATYEAGEAFGTDIVHWWMPFIEPKDPTMLT